MTFEEILQDNYTNLDIELSEKYKDWEHKGFTGCSLMEYQILFALASCNHVENVLELGPGKGASTETLLMALRRKNKGKLLTVDILPESEIVLVTDRSRFTRFGGNTNVFFAQNKETFDLVFIDADHASRQSEIDIENAIKFLNPGGKIACHDLQLFDGNKKAWETDIQGHVLRQGGAHKKGTKLIKQFGYGLGLIY